ncbi:hypothetical protein jhhlp_008503 [Lomentospora prolificans]|uniref:Uncharacterized protein n=1 Tax=Lomentospora prolificans TaxID=41688 RepID=A0A2N3MY88_9PEZI|nr:hypothetical protein jhhlp_008503 [Lomentospora prolificans]
MEDSTQQGDEQTCPAPDREEVRQQAQATARRIIVLYTKLHETISRHESTIRKRWNKKHRTERLKVLLIAQPTLPEKHRPDLEAFRQSGRIPGSQTVGPSHRNSYLLPALNQEDLLLPRSIPLLLNARGRNHPSAFAATDCDACYLGVESDVIQRPTAHDGTILLTGISSANNSNYGKVVFWDEDADAEALATSGIQFLLSEGLLVLEAQEILLDFLIKLSKQILHDIPTHLLTSAKYPILPEPEFKCQVETTGFESLAAMASEAPYRLPGTLNWERIVSLLEAKTAAAEDHLWSLIEDPGYFAAEVSVSKDHARQMALESTIRRGSRQVCARNEAGA